MPLLAIGGWGGLPLRGDCWSSMQQQFQPRRIAVPRTCAHTLLQCARCVKDNMRVELQVISLSKARCYHTERIVSYGQRPPALAPALTQPLGADAKTPRITINLRSSDVAAAWRVAHSSMPVTARPTCSNARQKLAPEMPQGSARAIGISQPTPQPANSNANTQKDTPTQTHTEPPCSVALQILSMRTHPMHGAAPDSRMHAFARSHTQHGANSAVAGATPDSQTTTHLKHTHVKTHKRHGHSNKVCPPPSHIPNPLARPRERTFTGLRNSQACLSAASCGPRRIRSPSLCHTLSCAISLYRNNLADSSFALAVGQNTSHGRPTAHRLRLRGHMQRHVRRSSGRRQARRRGPHPSTIETTHIQK